jgi:predicted nucleic acid-binding Zn ribbon protein
MGYNDRNVIKLGDAIRAYLRSRNMDSKFSEAALINSWEGVVGAMIAKHTVRMRVSQRKLYVEMDNAALRNELSYAREKIKTALNRQAGAEIIDAVIFK